MNLPLSKLKMVDSARVSSSEIGVAIRAPTGDYGIRGVAVSELHQGMAQALERGATRATLLAGIAPLLLPAAEAYLTLLLTTGAIRPCEEIDAGRCITLADIARLPTLRDFPSRQQTEREVLFYGCTSSLLCFSYVLQCADRIRVTRLSDTDLLPPSLSGKESQSRPNLVVAALGSDDIEAGRRLTRYARDRALSLLTVWAKGMEIVLGPLFIPGHSPCWNCLRERMLANAPVPWASRLLDRTSVFSPTVLHLRRLSLVDCLAVTRLAIETANVLFGNESSRLTSSVFIEDMRGMNSAQHAFIGLASCAECGGTSSSTPSNTHFGSRWGMSDEDQPVPPHILPGWIDPWTGIISDVFIRARAPNEPQFPICAAARIASFHEEFVETASPESASGKGDTTDSAFRAAVAESIERYSAASPILQTVMRIRQKDLESVRPPVQVSHSIDTTNSYACLDPREIGLYSCRQYSRAGFPFIPYEPDKPHIWVEGHWLATGDPVWIPGLLVYYWLPQDADDPYCQVTSNGLAAAESIDEACISACLELIERDAVLRAWLSRSACRRIRLDSSLSSGTLRATSELTRCGASLELYLCAAMGDVPCILALAFGDGVRWPSVAVGSAAHLNSRRAIEKAVYEASCTGTSLLRAMHKRPDEIPVGPEAIRTFFEHGLYYVRKEHVDAFNFIRSNDARPIDALLPSTSPNTDAKALATRLERDGVRVAVVHVTAPDVMHSPVRVVRAVATNLQPLHCGYGLERVPTQCLKAMLGNEQMNSDPHPLA